MSSPAIKLAPERHAQIKAISAALGHKTISETVAHFINTEITKGTIPAGFDGITISPAGDGVAVTFDDQPSVKFSKESARALAASLREFTDAKKRAGKDINMKHNFTIERKGSGVKLTIPLFGAITKSFSRDLAHDVADLIAS